MTRKVMWTVAVCTVIFGSQADAAIQSATFTGWYDSTGFHDASNSNYLVGPLAPGYHNFAVFDLSSVSGTISLATVRFFNPSNGFASSSASETFALSRVTTVISDLTATHSGRTDIWTDLADGPAYGQTSISAANNNSFVSIVLNSAGLADLNAAVGGSWAVGGSFPSPNGPVSYAFALSQVKSINLEFSTVPEPSTLVLLSLLGGVAAIAHRRHGFVSRIRLRQIV